jgi:trypsin-like peptidase/fibronectin type III domain protein
MKTPSRLKAKIKSLLALLFLLASLATLFGSSNTQPGSYPQSEPEVSVPGIFSTSNENGGMRTRAGVDLPSVRYGAHIDWNRPGVTLEQLDARAFALKPNQIGVNRSVAVSSNTRAQEFVNSDGSKVVVLTIKSSGASGIGVHFRNFALADGEEVYVYGAAADSIVFGPFADKGPWGSGEFWSGTVDGDTAVIEFYKKAEANEQGFDIFEISHIFAELDWRLPSVDPDVLDCEVDASCYNDPQKNAVGRILFNDNGMYVCSGTLLNNSAQNRTPYFLTANHCVNTQAVAQTVEVFWFYQTTSCNSGVLRSWIHSPPGTNLLATQSANDFSLLRLLTNPPAGTLFAGWTTAPQTPNASVFGLHHPDGYTPPAVTSYLRRATGVITATDIGCVATGLTTGYLTDWFSGATEGGASGSGLFTSAGNYLVGVDSCGTGACDSRHTSYSKFANFYPQIRQYINSTAPSSPVLNPATFVTSNGFRANWRTVLGATGYRLDVATNNSFTNYVAGYHNLNVGNQLGSNITGLNPSSTYYQRVRAYNANGTSNNSNVVSVTTLSPTGPPFAITNPADMIEIYSAEINGAFNPHGLSTTVHLQWGRTLSYGSRTRNQTMTGNNYQNVNAILIGLSSRTTYHFRAVATNARGTRYGVDRAFTTR